MEFVNLLGIKDRLQKENCCSAFSVKYIGREISKRFRDPQNKHNAVAFPMNHGNQGHNWR